MFFSWNLDVPGKMLHHIVGLPRLMSWELGNKNSDTARDIKDAGFSEVEKKNVLTNITFTLLDVILYHISKIIYASSNLSC